MRTIPATLQTTYANLLQMHMNRPVFDFQGAPFTMVRKGKTYWYANQRSADGSSPRQRYLGPDSEDMRQRIEQMRVQQQNLADFRANASSLVAQLRAGGIVGPDRRTGPILRAMTNSGVFRLGGTLVGTHAFRHYDLILGVHLSDATTWITQTDDIDIASFERVSMAIEDTADPDLAGALDSLGFKAAPSMTPKTPTSWVLADGSYTIDFLTPSFSDREQPARLAALKMWAQGLHFLNYLIAEPIPAVSPYMEGLLVQIPQPARYAVHKLIISQRRAKGTDAKRRKDIAQARAIIWAMAEDQPYELEQAIKDADGRGEQWRKALDKALEIRFDPASFRLGGNEGNEVMRLSGRGLGEDHRFLGITIEALAATFGEIFNPHEVAASNRSKIEALIQKKFRLSPASNVVVGLNDLAKLT